MSMPYRASVHALLFAPFLWVGQAEEPGTRPAEASSPAATPHTQVQTDARADIEKRRQEVEQQARQSLDQEAIAAIAETRKVVQAIERGSKEEALAALERATGRIEVLLGRNPQTALLPVDLEVEVIESAPLDLREIERRAEAAEGALEDKDYPAARVLLEGLVSEIRVRTARLPLVSYPIAMRDAAGLLEQNRMDEAKLVLEGALNTLVMIDRVTPLPLALAQAAIRDAEMLREKDREAAKRFLTVARHELKRAKALGYAGKDETYEAFDESIAELEDKLDSKEDTSSLFARLKERVSSFFKRESDDPKSSEVAKK